ncbi:hypothetical protein ACFVS9_28510 [Streptomyces sp. NPDC058008]|uniref:hypothetical protein n=1 Tax=Streptomyces sp. NPDC058008 TaxID=3346303 RepID=UPI0036EDF543
MFDARTEEIRARHEAATPEPWGTGYDGAGTYTIEARPRFVPGSGEASVHDGIVATLTGEHCDGQTYCNADFIARARGDVPYLLDRITKLEAVLDRVGGLAAWLKEFAENELRADDRELYTAIANDLRACLAIEDTRTQQSAATKES